MRRILLAEKVRWRRTRSQSASTDPESALKRTAVVELCTAPPPGSTVICADELGPVIPRTFPPAPFADPDEIACATQVATAQLNARARPWIWGRPQPEPRSYRRRFVYLL